MKFCKVLFSAMGVLVPYFMAHCVSASVTFTSLVSFNGDNGALPWAPLVQGLDGNFYGTAETGGFYGGGTVFKMTLNGTVTVLHSFGPIGTDGMHPKAGLLLGADGNFYGTTTDGGNGSTPNPYSGHGVVFRITPTGEYTILSAFNGSNGSQPWAAPLVQGSNGDLYGTTAQGGSVASPLPNGNGTVFRISTNGALNSLFSFHIVDGFSPYGGLTQGNDGNFYGTTAGGSLSGTVFRITTNGSLTTLVSFNGPNGYTPFSALCRGQDGNFYGTTTQGGVSFHDPGSVNGDGFGTIFKMTPSGTLTTLFSFSGTNGSYPYATLLQGGDGFFYGTTLSGGVSTNELFPGHRGLGTIFRFSTNGTLTTLHEFNRTDGAQLFANLVRGRDGNFYGTTVRGGANDLGTVFQLGVSSPPTIACPNNAVIECGDLVEMTVQVSDPDGDALTIVWTMNGQPAQTNSVPASNPSTETTVSFSTGMPLDTNLVTISVTDTGHQSTSCSTTIVLADSTAPVIASAVASPNVLWPPNHQMVPIKINAIVTDACSSTTWKIISIKCNEPVNGTGDGNTASDWVITSDHTANLRAEVSGKGDGRIYSITIQATDAAGNLSVTKVLSVVIPKNQGKQK